MYVKLNFSSAIAWKDVFNMLRIILANNITSISDLTAIISPTTFNTTLPNTESAKLDSATSEIVRTLSPGVGYGSPSVIWAYNWSGPSGTPSYSGNFTAGPEIVIERNVSSYSPSSGSDTAGKYYIRLRYDPSSLTSTVKFSGTLNTNTTTGGILTVTSFVNGIGSINIGQTILTGTSGGTSATVAGTVTVVSTYGTSGNQWLVSSTLTNTNITGEFQAYNSNENGLYVGTFKTAPPGWTTANVNGTASNSPSLTNGEDRLQGFGMSTITSFFLYMTPTSFLIGGKGPTGSKTDQGWITSLPRTITNYAWDGIANTSQTLTNPQTYWGDGTKIRFDNPTSGTANTSNASLGLSYYVKNIDTTTFSYSSSLASLRTKAYLTPAALGSNNILIDSLIPHNPITNNNTAAQFGPAFVSEFTPYDPIALTANGYIPVMYTGGVYQHATSPSVATGGNSRSYYGISAQDLLWADPSIVPQAYKVLGMVFPTPTLQGSWTQAYKVPVYIGTDLRTIERGPLGDQTTSTLATPFSATSTTINTKTLGPALTDIPYYKFPDANLNPSFGLFPFVWSASRYHTAGGKLNPALAGFMLFNGEYQPDDYFTYQSTTYALWPLADGFLRRLGLAVPKA